MLEAIHWTTAVAASGLSILVVGVSVAAAVGYYKRTIEQHAEALAEGKDEFKSQGAADVRIEAQLKEMIATCKGRQREWDRNERDHEGFHTRISTLEVSIAAQPGIIMKQMEPRFAELSKQLRTDVAGIRKEMLYADKNKRSPGPDSEGH